MPMWLVRWVRSDWWFVATFVIPAMVTGVGGLYFVHYIADQRTEIQNLRAQLAACSSKP